MKRMLIDTNVVLDVFTRRPGYIASHAVLSLSEQKIFIGFISQGSLYTCMFVLRKKLGNRMAKAHLAGLLTIVRLASCSNGQAINGLLSNFPDGEDALQHETAAAAGADVIVTRNVTDFIHSKLPVYTPERFLKVKF